MNMEKNKKILSIIILLVIFVLLAFGISYFFIPSSVPYYPIEPTADKLITNETLINMIVFDRLSPLGNNLTMTHLNNTPKTLFYVCTKNEHSGWVYYQDSKNQPALYGPYGWCLI